MPQDAEDRRVQVDVVGGPLSEEELRELFDGRFELRHCATPSELNAALSADVPDVMLLEAGLATGEDGLLVKLKQNYRDLPVIVVAKDADVEMAVRCIKQGAYDFVPRAAAAKLPEKVLRASEEHRLLVKVNQLESTYRRQGGLGELVGVSLPMQTIYTTIKTVAGTDATVLIWGESGTGKELVAKAIHQLSERREGEFVPVNCAAIPKDLLESELFGHEAGAFTGAASRRIGCCERAHRGTLFLDEICEMDAGLQSKLLRFLQDHTFTRVGGTETLKVDTRVIAATNRNPQEEVRKGGLREDLFYRLHVVPIEIPPLRERPEDIPVLAQHYLERLGDKYNKYFVDFSPDALDILLRYKWPGNVRELMNTLERIIVQATSDRITAELFPDYIRTQALMSEAPSLSVEGALEGMKGALKGTSQSQDVLPIAELEKQAILSAIRRCRGDISQAARKLGISRATIYRKLEKYGIRQD